MAGQGSGSTMEEGGPWSEMECIIIELRVEDVNRELMRCTRGERSTKSDINNKCLFARGGSNGNKELLFTKNKRAVAVNKCNAQDLIRRRTRPPDPRARLPISRLSMSERTAQGGWHRPDGGRRWR